MLIIIQVGFYGHAAEGARAAAAHGVRVAQTQGGTEESGREAASRVMDQIGGLKATEIEVVRTAEEVTVEVSGTPLILVPIWSPTVSASATGPVERWVDP